MVVYRVNPTCVVLWAIGKVHVDKGLSNLSNYESYMKRDDSECISG